LKINGKRLVAYIHLIVYLHKQTNKKPETMTTATTTTDRIKEETINFINEQLDRVRADARANKDGAFELQTQLYSMISKLEGDSY